MQQDLLATDSAAIDDDGSFVAGHWDGLVLLRAGTWERWLGIVWLLVMPITSVLVIPGVQGTMPAVVCAGLAVLGLLAVRSQRGDRVLVPLATIAAMFALLQCASAFAAEYLPVGLESHLTFMNQRRIDRSFLPTVATQSAYLAVGVVTALYAREFFGRRWESWVFSGAMLLIAYGVYEWLYFLNFEESGDFLSNRAFSDTWTPDRDAFSGSLVQMTDPLGFPVLRFKSLTGEPSMFAMTTLPYFFLAFCTKRYWIAGCLLTGLLLSLSSTALVALPTGFVLWLCFRPAGWRPSYHELVAVVLIAAVGIGVLCTDSAQQLIDFFTSDLREKLLGKGDSGQLRLESHQESMRFFLDAPLPVQVFGLGFGATRPFSFLDWLLINCGVMGTAVWLTAFLWPVIRLSSASAWNVGLKVALSVTLLAMLVGVPEFSYPTNWLFLGLAYGRLSKAENGP
jgi:hypothetical protein